VQVAGTINDEWQIFGCGPAGCANWYVPACSWVLSRYKSMTGVSCHHVYMLYGVSVLYLAPSDPCRPRNMNSRLRVQTWTCVDATWVCVGSHISHRWPRPFGSFIPRWCRTRTCGRIDMFPSIFGMGVCICITPKVHLRHRLDAWPDWPRRTRSSIQSVQLQTPHLNELWA